MAKGYVWIIGIVGLLILWQMGVFNGLGSQTPAPNPSGVVNNGAPSTQLTAITLNTKNALATSDVNANVSYYLFGKDGSFISTGSTVAGTATFNVQYGNTYDLLVYSDSAYYPAEVSFTADSGQGAAKTINIGMNPVSNITISKVRDPIDLDQNITTGLGTSVNFEIVYYVTVASAETYKPVIAVVVNQTAVQDVNLAGLSKVTCPARLSTTAATKRVCFQAPTVKTTDGVQVQKGTILFSGSTAAPTTDTLVAQVLDTQEYANPNYAVTGRSAFNEGTENPNTLANVGAADSATASIQFAG